MIWQDVALTMVSTIFAVSLFPQIYNGYKKKAGVMSHWTSVPTFLALYVTVVVYFSLHLYFSASTTFVTGTCWLILFLQKLVYSRPATSQPQALTNPKKADKLVNVYSG